MSTWTHIVKALSSDYDSLKNILEQGPILRCILGKKGKETILTIVETYKESSVEVIQEYNTLNFDKCIDWANEQLEPWNNVRRMSYNQWYFKRKKDAEKFITLFTVKWA